MSTFNSLNCISQGKEYDTQFSNSIITSMLPKLTFYLVVRLRDVN